MRGKPSVLTMMDIGFPFAGGRMSAWPELDELPPHHACFLSRVSHFACHIQCVAFDDGLCSPKSLRSLHSAGRHDRLLVQYGAGFSLLTYQFDGFYLARMQVAVCCGDA